MKADSVGDFERDSGSLLNCAGANLEKALAPYEMVLERGTARENLEAERSARFGVC